jgi:hypothetical protein
MARNRSYILGDERFVRAFERTPMHLKCTQFVPNKIALSTLGAKDSLQIGLVFPRFEGGEGGNASQPKKLGPNCARCESLAAA